MCGFQNGLKDNVYNVAPLTHFLSLVAAGQQINAVFPLSMLSWYLSSLFFATLQSDMQRGVHGRLMDNSTSVREAAVELLGKFVLSRPQLTEQYYDMLVERILVS